MCFAEGRLALCLFSGSTTMVFRLAILLTLLACALPAASLHAAPFTPGDASLVVLRVPSDPLLKRIATLESDLERDPQDTGRVYAATDLYIELGRRTMEPRYFGHAEALLNQRLQTAPEAAELRLQLADILQYRHEFEPALAQVSLALERERGNPRAHLMRAAIYQAS